MKPNVAWSINSDPAKVVGGPHELVQQQIAPGRTPMPAGAAMQKIVLLCLAG